MNAQNYRGLTTGRRTAIVLLCVALLAAGCAPSAIRATHGYVLVRTLDATLVPAPDDDPLYALFEREILADAYLRSLLDLCEHTTEAYVATDMPNRLHQTVGNYPIIVLNGPAPGVLRNIVLRPEGAEVPIERALCLGGDGESALIGARQAFARVCGGWLLELVGVPASEGDAALDQPGDAGAALSLGLITALEALDADNPSSEAAARRADVQANAYADGLSRAEAMRTPGVAAAFFYRLLQQTGPFYPQRYMLWFMNYPGSEMPLAKTLRVCQRLGAEQDLTLDAFIIYYAETYPAERSAIRALADEVFGKAEAHDERGS